MMRVWIACTSSFVAAGRMLSPVAWPLLVGLWRSLARALRMWRAMVAFLSRGRRVGPVCPRGLAAVVRRPAWVGGRLAGRPPART